MCKQYDLVINNRLGRTVNSNEKSNDATPEEVMRKLEKHCTREMLTCKCYVNVKTD